MRLIDADRLKAKITGITKPHEFVEEIDKRPTVEAIPIEWLRTWFTKKGSLIGITLVGEIESDWEKENE